MGLPRDGRDYSPRDGIAPEDCLSGLIHRELRIVIHSADIRRFIRDHWSKVSTLAHQIHDEADRYAHIPAGDG